MALSDVASARTEAAENLSQMRKNLTDIYSIEWIIAEQAAKHLRCESVKAFEKFAAREGIAKHYLSARSPRYNCTELDTRLAHR